MKRASHSNEHRKKRTKSYHCSKERTGSGAGAFQVQPNMSGIMVTCTRSKESRAQKEVTDLFEEYARKLYSDDESEQNKEEEEEEEEQLDLEAQVAKELAELKQPAKDNNRTLFANIATNMDCVLFIKTRPPVEPVPFVHRILTDLKKDKQQRTRYTSRFLPIENTCHANMNAIEKMAELIVGPKFHDKPSKSFAVMCRIRNCTKLDRMTVVQTLAKTVGEGHRVDLENPDLAIIVEICQNICMMSVVEDFNELKKYNLESLLGLNDGGPPPPKNKASKPEQQEHKQVKQDD
ncbi:hypothetical protein BDB00DRAFT_759362 [Zychaea mexicana]|uniref:uncharacterized protein n=1 Tax=Zychaea mexicana TaxID=64656 RepID=UPI0022FE5973|nr:uncharacterized protein BDB00DRAFT_759362 [Zychaea mexicana]KAI9495983.1 hypothetical protein BDB00DRAFT_759362 [Zychaea mexicana]